MNVKESDNKSPINLGKECLTCCHNYDCKLQCFITPVHKLQSKESIEDDDFIDDEMDELMDEDWINGPK